MDMSTVARSTATPDSPTTASARMTECWAMRRPKASGKRRPRMCETIAMKSTLKVLTVIPPVTAAEAPPMNIRTIRTISVSVWRRPISMVEKPVVRQTA